MRRLAILTLCLLGLQAVQITTPWADTRYVTESIEIALRAGESSRYRIIRMLPSGTPLEIISAGSTPEYVRVRTLDGTVGYVLERELQDQPAAVTRVAELERRLVDLQAEPEALAARLATLQGDYARVETELRETLHDKQTLEQELATIRHASSNILEITAEREQLRLRLSELIRERADLLQANRDLTNQTNQRWFMIGAGVVLMGVLIGLLLPHLSLRRRRDSWESL